MRRTSSILIAIVLMLLAFGIVMLASTSSVRGTVRFHDPQYFLKRQLVWLLFSLILGVVVVRFDYHWWRRLSAPMALLAIASLGLVFVPGIGAEVWGSHRWLRVGPFSIQPSEFAKLAVVIVLADWLAAMGRRAGDFWKGLFFPVVGLSVVLGLLLLEPDFGATLLVGVVGMTMLFAGGVKLGYLVITSVLGGCAFMLAVMRNPERMRRILAFLMPEKYPDDAYQLAQSKIAFIMGDWFGVGLGNSIQKQFYLPEAHTDFILAIIGEELGVLATVLILALFLGLLVCGMIIAFKAPDPFGRFLAFGLTMMVVLQAAINIGVVTGCLPTKGLPLPFISYGGSSLAMSFASVCVLLNITRHVESGHLDEHTRPIKDSGHHF